MRFLNLIKQGYGKNKSTFRLHGQYLPVTYGGRRVY